VSPASRASGLQRVMKREAVEVRRDGETVWRVAATQTSA
jgi:hypothetical protein